MARKNNKKELIIGAAVRVFARKGFYSATVADVARAAGVADGTIYLYFKNKDDLLISLFETKMEAILLRFSALLETGQPADQKLRAFIALYFEMIAADPDLAEVFQVELRQSDKFLKHYHNQKFIDFLNLIGRIVEEGKAQGLFRRELQTHTMKLILFGALDELARQWILTETPGHTLDQTAGETCDVFLKSMMIK